LFVLAEKEPWIRFSNDLERSLRHTDVVYKVIQRAILQPFVDLKKIYDSYR
jgi:hypothetical protein